MKPAATVLYEDSMVPGSYPLHELVMRLVEDDINGETRRLLKQVVANPRNGIDNILKDVRSTDRFAGGGKLFLLVDRDRIARHLKLPGNATDEAVVKAVSALSDAPQKLSTFFLVPNLEGLLQNIQEAEPSLLRDEMPRALRKSLDSRDIVLKAVKAEDKLSLRTVLRAKQPGLDALAKALAQLLR
jgi:hypothetical protein